MVEKQDLRSKFFHLPLRPLTRIQLSASLKRVAILLFDPSSILLLSLKLKITSQCKISTTITIPSKNSQTKYSRPSSHSFLLHQSLNPVLHPDFGELTYFLLRRYMNKSTSPSWIKTKTSYQSSITSRDSAFSL